MKGENILAVVIWTFIAIEVVVFLVKAFKKPRFNSFYPNNNNYYFKEVCFEISNIKYIEHDIVEYTAIISFFKKENCKQFVYNEYRFYDKKDKYNIGDKLYLNKKSNLCQQMYSYGQFSQQ